MPAVIIANLANDLTCLALRRALEGQEVGPELTSAIENLRAYLGGGR